jgi:hypothetical protein
MTPFAAVCLANFLKRLDRDTSAGVATGTLPYLISHAFFRFLSNRVKRLGNFCS